ncbi:hypothetical protein HYN56_09890 [Flavobacterium crocinum]|uniref:Uncharacterized protein n=1 Tax=Flavobacterium crocinum TaxID=2183896 RepID=A0A2S1YKC1_9FLAO|nr:hypothetical protein HYN56_09890 [Flavobacterium crocinum]
MKFLVLSVSGLVSVKSITNIKFILIERLNLSLLFENRQNFVKKFLAFRLGAFMQVKCLLT